MRFLKVKIILGFLFFTLLLIVALNWKFATQELHAISDFTVSNFSERDQLSFTETKVSDVSVPVVITQPKASKINSQLERRYKTLSDNDNYPTLESRLQAMSERTHKTYEPEAVLDAMADRNAWNQLVNPPKTMPLTEIELHDGREFVAVDRLKIETLLPGDSLSLPVVQRHTTFEINIVSVDKNPNGSITWQGEIKRNDESYFVEITQSENITLAGISTPDGNFALQANGGEGWLAATDTLFKRNQHVSDAVTPPDFMSPPVSQ